MGRSRVEQETYHPRGRQNALLASECHRFRIPVLPAGDTIREGGSGARCRRGITFGRVISTLRRDGPRVDGFLPFYTDTRNKMGRSGVVDYRAPEQPRMAFNRWVPGSKPADGFADEALSYLNSLYGTALRLTRNAADAEDLVQDTYLKAFRFAHRFERGTNIKAWLFTILHNTSRNARRDAGRDPVVADSDVMDRLTERVPSDSHSTPEDLLLRETLGADLAAALDELPEVFRQAVWLRDVEGFTYAELAQMLEVPTGTVMSRISRGRRLLYERLRTVRTGSVAGSGDRRVEVARR